MAFLNIFRRKSSADFYALLLYQTEKTLSGYHAMARFLQGHGTAGEVRNLAKGANDIRKTLIEEICQAFFTPVDRDDIFELSRAIDDALDSTYRTVMRMEAFEVESNEFLHQMTELLQKAAEELVRAVRHLKENPNVAREHAVRAKCVKNEVGEMVFPAMREAFAGHDVRSMISYHEIYRHLNRSADHVDEAANIITNIVAKFR